MKILLAENDHWTGQQLKSILVAERYTVDWVKDGVKAAELALHEEYDLLLLDLVLPRLDGITICRQVRKQNCQIPILMLAATDCDRDLINALDAGADDLVEKLCNPRRMTAKIRVLLRRQLQTNSTSTLLTWGALTLDPALLQVTYKQCNVVLTPSEYRLLELFLRHPKRLLNRDEIIDRIWSMDGCPSQAAVTNLVKELRRKLKAAGMQEELLETVYGMGYRLMEAPTEFSEKSVPATATYSHSDRLWSGRQMASVAS
ncbi:response regulator transcription factor [Leptolyngbya ohadii]|uniref:response regulator transcription factor n=1 Tax=Leptolyngbya ohadii TaxID=1962290 RepID=UPI000B59C09D|nr:response regulator transcription factor [Leptolyngbya ohadii]